MSDDTVEPTKLLDIIKVVDPGQSADDYTKITNKFVDKASEWSTGFKGKSASEQEDIIKAKLQEYKKLALAAPPPPPAPAPPAPASPAPAPASPAPVAPPVTPAPAVGSAPVTPAAPPAAPEAPVTPAAPTPAVTPAPAVAKPAVTIPPAVVPAPAAAAAKEENVFVKSYGKSKQVSKRSDGSTNMYIVGGCVVLAVLIGGGIAYTVYRSQKKVRDEPSLVN